MKATRDEIIRRLGELQKALEERGFRVAQHPRAYLTVRNQVTSGDVSVDPGLSQVIALGPDGDGGALAWHWMWSGPTHDAPPEYERIAPADAIAEVVARTACVLALAPAVR